MTTMDEIGKTLSFDSVKQNEVKIAIDVLSKVGEKIGTTGKKRIDKINEMIEMGEFSEATKKAMREDAQKADTENMKNIQAISLTAWNSLNNSITLLKSAKFHQ